MWFSDQGCLSEEMTFEQRHKEENKICEYLGRVFQPSFKQEYAEKIC